MEIKIISTETIKPSSPTPQHLRTHKLFLPNHVMPDLYVPFTFFYSSPRENPKPVNNNKISVHLKNALSKTLTYYYPFAGQNIDGVSTQCNDHGAIFIETRVANISMSDVLKNRDKAQDLLNLKNLLPFNGMLPQIPTTATTPCHPNLFVQVNYFPCGGIAITIFFSHRLSDATTAANFVKSWGEVACGADDIKNAVVDFSSVYPPCVAVAKSFSQQKHYLPSEFVTKVLAFDAKSIAALKEKIGNGPYLERPSRFEAITTLILGSLIEMTTATGRERAKQLAGVTPLNLRNKVNPPLPQQCVGNLIKTTVVKLPLEKKVDYNKAAGKLHDSVRKVVEEYKTKVHEHDEEEEEGEPLSESKIFHITDVSKLPFYEADFGWGKPKWVVLPALSDNVAILMSSSDGEGVEAWIGLPKEDMAIFEKLPDILAFSQTPSQLSIPKRARL